MNSFTRQQQYRRGRRRGIAAVYFALVLTGLIGVTAMVIDIGSLYKERSDLQKAADAAALAGAYVLQMRGGVTACNSGNRKTDADNGCGGLHGAYEVAALNGFDRNQAGITIVTEVNPNGTTYRVQVNHRRKPIFAGVLGQGATNVTASALAQIDADLDIPIDPRYYGKKGPVTYSQFGPAGLYSNGDPYSVTALGSGANTEYRPDGYDFKLIVPDLATYKINNVKNGVPVTQMQVEIFDPDCHNLNNQANASNFAVDELRGAGSAGAGGPSDATTTQYTLYWDRGTPNNTADDLFLASATYGDVSATDMKWVTPSGFTVDLADSRFAGINGNFRINVKTTAGASENGYNLRAGPPHADIDSNGVTTMSEDTWHHDYSGDPAEQGTTPAPLYKNGTQIAAEGHLPMNFNIDGIADIALGFVPASAKGGTFTINKFDTDVGARSVYYTCDTLPGQTFAGTLAGNGQWKADTINLPTNYSGGNWHAVYDAGSQDTSAWSLSYSGADGSLGGIKLIG